MNNKSVVLITAGVVTMSDRSALPKVFHYGLSVEELRQLKRVVRKSEPTEFWHQNGPLSSWVGQDVLLVLRDDQLKEIGSVRRTIVRCYDKPVAEITDEDLEGSLAAIAMEEREIPFLTFFNDHGGGDMAMVIELAE